MPFQEVEHTADLALRITGADLHGLFFEACRGMFWLAYGDKADTCSDDWRRVVLRGSGYEMILVEWLNELLYLCERDHLRVIEVQFVALSEQLVDSRVSFCSAGAPVHDIKAVTYSDLALQHTDEGLSVLLTFDV